MRRLLLAALALTACTSDDPVTAKPCDGLLKPADPSVALPAGIPAGVPDPVLYETQKLGATTLYFGHAAGDDVVAVRDAVLVGFEKAGLTIEATDAEPPAEAELQFTTAKDEGSVQVTPLCDARVTIRWRVGPR